MKQLPFWPIAAPLLALCAGLACAAALGDSVTVDEPSHLVAGTSALETGDFRMSPDHPPLGRMWAALPLLFVSHRWPPPETPGWREGDFLRFGRTWFAANDPDRLIQPPRAMAVVLLLALCLAVAATAGRLFGPPAALLGLLLAALDPGLLGHGHLATMDVPFALAALAALLAAARLLAAPSLPRLALAGLALAAAALVKFSWVLLLPALALMAGVATVRPLVLSLPGRTLRPERPAARALAAAVILLALLAAVWGAVWAAYGFRFGPFRGADRETARMETVSDFGRPRPATQAEAWETVLHDPATGRPLGGPASALVSFARDRRLLPEAYLYGAAFARKKAMYRAGYLLGEYSTAGWRSYFPVAFAVKTPLATLFLLAAGLAAVAARRARPFARDPLLAAGLFGFAAVYAAAAVASRLDIGHRHLLPLYPAVFVIASAAITWRSSRAGRALLAGAAAWLLASSLLAFPRHLAYFNEAAGGWRNGHRFLADSNLDWGQDLERLAAWARRHQEETIKLAQFGEGPLPRGFAPEALVSEDPARPLAPLGAGTYAVSATELLGVYQPLVRDATWADPRFLAGYRDLAERVGEPLPPGALGRLDPARVAAERDLDLLRRARLIQRLRHRPPDERIGASLFLYRLSRAEVEALVRP